MSLVFTQGEILKTNLAATTDPTVNDDITQGYQIGSTWINTTANKVYIATDVTTGAAIWRSVSPPSGTANGDLAGTYPSPTVEIGRASCRERV